MRDLDRIMPPFNIGSAPPPYFDKFGPANRQQVFQYFIEVGLVRIDN